MRSSALLVVLLSACPPAVSAPCADGQFAVGDTCLKVLTARVRRDGVFSALPTSAVTVTKRGAHSVALSVSASAPVEAFELTLDGVDGTAMLQQGYQSWSFSGAVTLPGEVPLHADGALAAKAISGNPLDEVPGVSYGGVLLGGGASALALATSDASVATTVFAKTKKGSLTILYGPERVTLPSTTMPEVIIASGAANDARAELAQQLPSTRTPTKPPRGWFSWNELFDAVTQTDVVENAELVKTQLLPHGFDLVELDDGWEIAWGDWHANSRFPGGMSGVGAELSSRGLKAGVWLAPFLVETNSAIAATLDPALFVRDEQDQPIRHKPPGLSRTFYVLDGTNPAAMAVAAGPISELKAAGFTFFKLDYLYAGAIPGKRVHADATPNMALVQGLATLRTAMGDDAILNGCGAPIFPLVGLADSLRIGTDTAYAAVDLAWPDVAAAARSTSAHWVLSPRVYLDGDQAQLRAPYSLDEARASAVTAALSGPSYSLGDDLRTLPAERLALALDASVLNLVAGPAMAEDPLEAPVRELMLSPVIDAVLNGNETGAPPPSRFTTTGADGAKHTITFSWAAPHGVTIQ